MTALCTWKHDRIFPYQNREMNTLCCVVVYTCHPVQVQGEIYHLYFIQYEAAVDSLVNMFFVLAY